MGRYLEKFNPIADLRLILRDFRCEVVLEHKGFEVAVAHPTASFLLYGFQRTKSRPNDLVSVKHGVGNRIPCVSSESIGSK